MRTDGCKTMAMLLAGVLASSVAPSGAMAQEQRANPARAEATGSPAVAKSRPDAKAKAKTMTSAAWHARHGLYFKRNWGVDIVSVRRVASGSMLRFDYRVVDPDRASVLTDKTARPYLIDERTRTALAVPAMENIGELRQVAPLETNRTYYMIFGNPGGLVKRGGRVSLVVGNFRAEGLLVD
jgi:hypothetical protein